MFRIASFVAVLGLVLSACTAPRAPPVRVSPTSSRSPPVPSPPVQGAPSPPPPAEEPEALGPLAQQACSLPTRYLERIWNGYFPGRSGDIQMVTHGPDYVGLASPHNGPQDYLQRVPMLLFGPGYIRRAGAIDRPVRSPDLAATLAELLGFDFDAPDGEPMVEALVPAQRRPTPPRLIVTVVWDAGGRVVLDAWPRSLPNLQRRLIPRGAWYEHATLGTTPSATAPLHATIGTGAFPRRHGLVANKLRNEGRITGPWRKGPSLLRVPTLADAYDAALDNRPLVGVVATVPWHLGLIGHGSSWEGGDEDIAVLKRSRKVRRPGETFWAIPPASRRFYRFPSYVQGLPGIDAYVAAADLRDGVRDGRWLAHLIEEEREGFDTPARLPFQTRVIEEVVAREGFGQDDVTDLLFINYKLIDEIGHIWSLNSPEMEDAVRAQDEETMELVRFLNRRVGRGKWVLAVTADHGHTPDPAVSGAFQIDPRRLDAAVVRRFDDADDVPLIQLSKGTHLYLNPREVRQNGDTLAQVARYIGRLTKADAAPYGVGVRPQELDDPAFRAVFPSRLLPRLPCLPERARGGP